MSELVLPVLVGTVVAFLTGGIWYGVLGTAVAAEGPAPRWVYGVEIVRCLVLAAVVVGLAAAVGVGAWWSGLVLGLVLWIGFPLVLWTGAITHERTPLRTAALHGGDWLVKLLALGLLAGLWL